MKSPILAILIAAPLMLGACEEVKKTTVVAPEGTTVTTTPGATVTTPEGTVKTPSTVTVTPPTVPSAAPVGRQDTCGAAAYQPLIGQTNPAIKVATGVAYRQVKSGDPVTMDLNLERLNFEYDKSGKLLSVTCG